MADLNSISIKGNLTRDPETQHFTDDKRKTTVSIACNGYSKDDVDFINLSAWGKQSDFMQSYFSKGDPIIVTGRLRNRQYEKDGNKLYFTEIECKEVMFGGKKKEEQETTKPLEDDIPF